MIVLADRAARAHPARGFTLVELMVVVALTALLVALAAPSLQALVQRNAVSGHVNAFVGSLRLARAQALQRGLPVKMCRSADAESAASLRCASGIDWSGGWIVFIDRNDNGIVNPDDGDVVLRVQGALSGSGGVNSSGGSTVVFRFRPTGLLGSGATQMTFDAVGRPSGPRRRVCISLQGRTRVIAESDVQCDGSQGEL